ncbi:putative integral membrane protein [Theileria parva strain Muguga]|uniref:Uncharacterized protein n=1 Tax=Theileria parva TaxID=5875 RepID=Q4N3H7_THEPA|nr:putative integral membrane protein [Theileria parva strain Muguga]EAN31765.1 putative integral membrane protein [Theileria parva strain Muguga]|eukprot:XP_764048.1 hypothetical protein [Theileria parva strain Muguga]
MRLKIVKGSGLRLFSTQSHPGVPVSEGLYSRTARPLENLSLDGSVSSYSEGLKSCRIFDNPNIIRVIKRDKETLLDKLYRYMDIGGFFTMLNSRKVHLLRTPAEGRPSLMCFTEFERKQSLIMKAVLSLLLYYVYYCYVRHKLHIYDRHPSPELPTFEFTNNRTKDFTWHGSLPFQYPKGRCKECRWLELECKKRCYDDLLQQGHQFILQNPMQIPRRQLLPSPYPPA